MKTRYHLSLAALAALAATPALPCSLAIDDMTTAGLIPQGARDVPTRVHVAFSGIGVFDTVQIDELDGDQVIPVASLVLEGEVGLAGLVTLAPSRQYRLTASSLVEPVLFTTGTGEDTVGPDAPEVGVDVQQRGPELNPFVDSCGGGGFNGGSTRVDVLVAGGADTVGFLAKDPQTGAVVRTGRDGVSFFSRDAGVDVVDIVALDAAGNESTPVPVTIDFGGPGGCGAVDARPLWAFILAGLVVRRRRRG